MLRASWATNDALLSTFEKQLAETSYAVPDTYGRQYAGVTEGSKKVMRVTFFCDQEVPWHREFDRTTDGEPCLLRAVYFVDAQKIAPLWYAGPGGPTTPERDR